MSSDIDHIAISVATSIDRRRFLRRSANVGFYVASVTAAGGMMTILRESAALAAVNRECAGIGNTGLGCPNNGTSGYPCGPSRCCNTTRPGTPGGCDCSRSSSADCKTHTDDQYCFGNDFGFWGTSSGSPGCWTCTSSCYKCGSDPPASCKNVTTCCDCRTDGSACNDPIISNGHGRCIAYHVSTVSC